MANLTLTIDARLLQLARKRALEHGTSVNALVRTYLAAYTGEQPGVAGVHAFLARARASGAGSGGRRWTREELHDRAALR